MTICKLDKTTRGWGGRKYAKRWLSRKRRKAARRDPENAGQRVKDYTTGWY